MQILITAPVWMFCGKTNLNKLEKLQERALATVYGDNLLS